MPEPLRQIMPMPTGGEQRLASWYAPGRTDGLGARLLMFDNSGAASLELLRFRPELASAFGFERALRQRVARLDRFYHRAFPGVRAVEYLDEGDALALVSTYTPGKRLSEMFHGPRLMGLHPAFATWLIRQLTPALAELQRHGPELSHGALAADRVVLTPEGTLVIVEHALGSALESLRLTPARFWTDFGILAPTDDDGATRLNRRTDVIQLGLLALSVLLGRRITPAEYPRRLGALIDEFSETATRRSPSLVPPLRVWLERALVESETAFKSAEDAENNLKELPDHGAPAAAIDHPLNRSRNLPAGSTKRFVESAEVDARLGDIRDLDTPTRIQKQPETRSESEIAKMKTALATIPDLEPRQSQDERRSYADVSPDTTPIPRQSAAAARFGSRSVLAALGAIAIVEGAVIAGLVATRPSSVAAAPLPPVLVDSPQAGDTIFIDGREAGVTPFQLKVGPDVHTIRIVSRAVAPPVIDVRQPDTAVLPASKVDTKTDSELAQAGARQKSGGLRLSSPIELKVLEGDRVLGSSADGPIVTTAGVHELELINASVGFRSRQSVTIKAGQIVSLAVVPPEGRLSINAAPWAQVWIDGNAAGETPLANVSAAVGEHEITFRHPQLGERRETVVVRSGALTRVSATLGR